MYPTSTGYKIKAWSQLLAVALICVATAVLGVKKYHDYQARQRSPWTKVEAVPVVPVPTQAPDLVVTDEIEQPVEKHKSKIDAKVEAVRRELTVKLKQEREAFARTIKDLKEKQKAYVAKGCNALTGASAPNSSTTSHRKDEK